MSTKQVQRFSEELVVQKKACGQMLVDAFEDKMTKRVRRSHFMKRSLYVSGFRPHKRGVSIAVFNSLKEKGPEASLMSAHESGRSVVVGSWLNGKLGWMLPVHVVKVTDKIARGLWKTTFYCERARR